MASSESSSNTSLPTSCLSESNTISLRDASFSSYLNNIEESYIHTLVGTAPNLNYHHPMSKPKKVEDTEIDVFSADKYFSGVIDQESNTITPKNQHLVSKNHVDKDVINLSKMKLQPRTPSVLSESSWNSQSSLLRPVLKNPSKRDNDIKVNKKSSFFSCYCCGKKSVDIEDNNELINHKNEYTKGITRTIKTSFDTAEITRLNKLKLDSTTPFGLSKSWDAIPIPAEKVITSGPTIGTQEDVESDASSDLFEIECHGPRNGSYGGTSPTFGYAPSEASVDWSVVTASAADFSALSDSEDQRSTLTSVTRGRVGPTSSSSVKKMSANKGFQKPRTVGILAGCQSQKAVRVAGDAYRSSDKRKSGPNQRINRFSDSYNSVTRFQAEAKLPKIISTSDLLYN